MTSQAASAIADAQTHCDERRARADLEALIETLPVGVLVVDAESGQAVSVNREARRIAQSLCHPGRPHQQLLEVMSFRRSDGSEVSLSGFPVTQLLHTGETMRAEEVVLSVPDGRSVRALVNATPIRADGDAIGSVVIIIQDLAPLDEIERLRTEFLGLVGHELRTPLAAIKGAIATVLHAGQTLDPAELREFLLVIDEQANTMRGLIGDLLVGHELREPLAAIKGSIVTVLDAGQALDSAELREFLRVIDEQTDNLRSLIGDLVDAGRIDSGTLSVSPEPAEIGDLVEQARSTFLSGGRRHGVVLDLPSDLPPVMADRRRIVQVLNNLFSNAARHAPESSPIRVAAAREDAHVAVAVSDEGCGVPPELLPRLFDKRAGGGAEEASHGLGLAICKGLLEAHGGSIRAESAGPGLGTTVTFTLPAAAAAGQLAVGAPAAPQPGEPVRILVVDGDPRTQRFVRDALSAAGYAPVVTGERQELARIIRVEKPRLVLLDLIQPGPDGIEQMQQLAELSDLPVIFISNYGRDETVARALETGGADYIVKPFSPTELVVRVRAALRRHEEPGPFVLGELAIDHHRRRVTVAGNPVPLTATEYELLRVLSSAAGRVVTYDMLLRRVWPGRADARSSPMRAFIRSLRGKLGDDATGPAYILTERGVGYRMPSPGEK